VIHLIHKNKVRYLIGNKITPLPTEPFSKIVCEFLDEISKLIMKDTKSRLYPDLISFAFWCRYTNLVKIKNSAIDDNVRIGKGVVFHITPSNLPINSLYSLVFGLLSGNSNIVKLPSKKFQQIDLFIYHFNKLTKKRKYFRFKYSILLIQYNSDDFITKYFSDISDIRMIWGGDNTIQKIKKINSKPRCLDLSFADRYSIGIINSEEICKSSRKKISNLASNFYNDTYIYDQNACSSPHLIIWYGKKSNIARKIFWGELNNIVKKKYLISDSVAIEKYNEMISYLIKLKIAKLEEYENNIYCIKLKKMPKKLHFLRGRYGIFFETYVNKIDDFANKIDDKFQTLTHYGMKDKLLRDFVIKNHLKGIDRIVPIGKALDMSHIWDGVDLIKIMSRIVKIN
jgi:hypothetical protein